MMATIARTTLLPWLRCPVDAMLAMSDAIEEYPFDDGATCPTARFRYKFPRLSREPTYVYAYGPPVAPKADGTLLFRIAVRHFWFLASDDSVTNRLGKARLQSGGGVKIQC